MGTLEAPQDKHGQEHRTGTSRAEQMTEAMAELGALEAWRCRELRRPWQVVFGARPPQPEPFLPPQNFPGEVRGYQEPSGAKQTGQYKTRQESPPGPDRQDRTAHRNQKPSWAGLEAEASSGHDQESEAHTGSLSDRLHIRDKGAGS